ncbi:DUF4393 domain-containing protein [Tissierella carlieri]|uniref:DUF4393 domain-containing protein n=1 Tax=Tissierella carlieri TaxID=689904 RepID=UPI002108710E|nr:DUF4393 domain-containing protein [Tissierella carlieri]
MPEAPKFLDESLTPASQEIGKTLGNIFYAVFSVVNYPIEKLRIKQVENLKKYEQDIKEELYGIPEDKLIDPPLNIVGPALEASKFYIEKEDLRKMFAKLISSSMNVDLTNYSHPSFIEIIKQFDSVEAQMIKFISERSFLPYIELIHSATGNDLVSMPIIEPYTKVEGVAADYSTISASIKNLQRLGLIHLVPISMSVDKPFIEELINDEAFNDYRNLKEGFGEENFALENIGFKIKTGNILLTSYGLRFVKVCL